MQKEKAAEMFDISPKHVNHFKIETPDKHQVEGWISKSRGSNMGSLIIETVDRKETLQFVRGMPKIHYLDDKDEITNPTILNKMDGTNIVMFPLMIDGECQEVCFKTRLVPEVQTKFMKRVDLAIDDNYYKAVEKNNLSFAYELYGYENPHEVNYRIQDIPIKMDLLTILDQGMSLPFSELDKIAKHHNIPQVMKVLDFKDPGKRFEPTITPEFYERYSEYMPESVGLFNSYTGLYSELERFFEKMNIKYQEKNQGGIIVEGAVWHYGDEENHMIKNKAISVREGHIKQACGIPITEIRKAVIKAEENGVDLSDDDKVISFVKKELLEEEPENMVNDIKTVNKIISFLRKYTRKVEITESLKEVAEKVIEEVGNDASPVDKMRAFSRMFPDQRKLASKLYQVFVKM